MDRNQEIALTQMRKSVEKLGSSTESYGEKTLMRFLIARSMNPEKAAKMFCQWKKWRAEMVPLGMLMITLNYSASIDTFASYAEYVVHLLDKTIASSFNGREIGNEKLIGILDLQNITYSNVDVRGMITVFQFFQVIPLSFYSVQTISIETHITSVLYIDSASYISHSFLLQAYYPERLATCYLLHMPQFSIS
ncbi:hypothetical protein H5410_000074 [Solanum commersonii]|uniref:CRAL-TRIO domain-containing protein n=1 Tax=Solanum commersonii TaxID=4109 RepID=A0A9J6AUV9_SOLCO|nr:hypothetical protein H5410_000074 [Solanum commersonii]